MTRRLVKPLTAAALAAALAFAVPAAADEPVHVVVNGVEIHPDVAPEIVGGRTLVPVRFVAEALGATVRWDEATRTVTVTAPAQAGALPDATAIVAQVRPSIVGVVALTHDAQGAVASVSSGSGVVIQGGIVVTNAHVVGDADTLYVVTDDGRALRLDRSAAWVDALSDLAFLRTGDASLPPAPLGDSDAVQVGEAVLTIGNPLGHYLADTVTRGILSGVGRYLPEGNFYYPFLQTDAAINPGNSGGALLDAQGRVIGITSMKMVQSSSVPLQGLGFAIPINTVRQILDDFQRDGRVVRPWLGVSLQNPPLVEYGLPTSDGPTVVGIDPSSPAAAAGIQPGDQILALDGQPVRTDAALIALLWSHRVGDAVSVSVKRQGTTLTLRAVLAERPAGQ